MTFDNRACTLRENFEINIDGNTTTRIYQTKYLGIIIDCHMRWNNQIEIKRTKYVIEISNKLSKILNILFVTRSLNMVMCGIYYSIVIYDMIVWDSANSNIIGTLFSIHNVRSLNNSRICANPPLNLKQRYTYTILSNCEAILPTYSNITIRSRNKLVSLLKIRKEIGKKKYL